MPLIQTLPNGKSQVSKNSAFCELLDHKLPHDSKIITDLLNEFDEAVRVEDSRITREALSNVHGDWYEWLLAITAWNYSAQNPKANLALLLPNILQFEVTTLYNHKLNFDSVELM